MQERLLALEQDFDRRVAELAPLDACAWLGYYPTGIVAYTGADALAGALAAQGVRGALVSHMMGELHDARDGNDALAAELPRLPGCAGVMTLLPGGTGEIDDPGACIDACLARGLRAARLYPKSHRYTLRVPGMDAVFAALEERGVPLLLPIGQTSFDELGPLGRRYPRLAIVVEGVGHHEFLNVRGCLPWLEAVPNLLVTTHRQFLCGGLELMVERLGAHRVVFSTHQPVDDPAAALSLLVYSELPGDDLARIAHGNLERLLRQVGHGGYFA